MEHKIEIVKCIRQRYETAGTKLTRRPFSIDNTRQSRQFQHGSNYSSCTSIGVVTLVFINNLNAASIESVRFLQDILINIFAPNFFNGLI